MGHEACGMPVKLGAKVDKHQIHLGKLYSALNLNGCTHGLNGASALLNSFGIGNDGSYAEYYITTFDLLVPVPEGVPPAVAAIASDTGVTAYHAVHHAAQVKPGDKVLIYGVGGVGNLAVQYAKHFGATVYIELNKRLAAGFTVNTTIDFVATNQTFTTAMAAVARNAVDFPVSPRVVLVGISAENLVFTTLAILSSEADSYGPRSALVAALDLFAKGTVRAHVSEHPVENVNEIIEELRASDVLGRKVVVARM
ncbi:hypothetical protein FB45DRAFT_1046569 [Roridomyces roridus]|uniref:Alcohol dehydrogenase n=1 Tax=Roridomyces roridus TaxID=1738132 RepID=A0AAD7F5M2_9AGAR|nr:hypothetical protein FB45DRAFT_1046569 [Roridomyces roridus]